MLEDQQNRDRIRREKERETLRAMQENIANIQRRKMAEATVSYVHTV